MLVASTGLAGATLFILVKLIYGILETTSSIDRYPYSLWNILEFMGHPLFRIAAFVLIFVLYYLTFSGKIRDFFLKNKFRYTMRWKFIFMFFLTLILTGTSVMLSNELLLALYQLDAFKPIVHWLINTFGRTSTILISCCIYFLLFFFILSRKFIHDMEEITFGLKEIAKGNLNYQIPVRSADELGTIADSVNQMASQLKKSIEEERNAERTKNDLITGVSHDLRTPLTSILGYLELIENDRYKDEVEFRYYTKIAYDKTIKLKKLIDDLFEYTSLHSKGPEFKMSKININGLLKQIAEEFVPMLNRAGMTYRMTTVDDKLYVAADANHLVRVYENLISNAVRYGSESNYVDIQIEQENDEIIVKIINYGAPIEEDDLPYLFERFYRAEKSRSSKTGGTGLGLAIAKSIIDIHGGRISVQSNKERTVFETRLRVYKDGRMAKQEE